jgi:hypothetical protein
LALWVAQRYDIPAQRSFKLLVRRFRSSQNPEGGWGYKYSLGGDVPEGKAGDSYRTGAPLVCAGLLGLALEYGLAPDFDTKGVPLSTATLTPLSFAIAAPSPLGLHLTAKAASRLAAAEAIAKKRTNDPNILAAFKALSKHVGEPAGRTVNLPAPSYYYLWTLERVAMLYDLKTIANKDWYRWGAEALLANQQEDGHWEGSYGPAVDTSFALLFLRQANLTQDLTNKLKDDPNAVDKPEAKNNPAPPEAGKVLLTNAVQPSRGKEVVAAASVAVPKSSPSAKTIEVPDKPLLTKDSGDSVNERATTAVPQRAASDSSSQNSLLLWIGGGVAGVLIIGSAILLMAGLRRRQNEEEEEPAEPSRLKRSVSIEKEDGRKRQTATGKLQAKKRPTRRKG